MRVSGQFSVKSCVPDKKIAAILLLLKNTDDIGQRLDTEYREVIAFGGLKGGTERQDASGYSQTGHQVGERQSTLNLPHGAIQAELAHNQVFVKSRETLLLGSRKDADGDRQVIAAAVLPHIGRGQIDHDLLSRNPETQRLKGGDCPQKAFLDRRVGQADQMYSYSLCDVHLHGDGDCLDADALRPKNVYQHSLKSFMHFGKDGATKRKFSKETEISS